MLEGAYISWTVSSQQGGHNVFSVIFEVHPKRTAFDLYLNLAKNLKPMLEGMDGFVDNERFESTSRAGWILSHSTWRDEKALVRWRTIAMHHETQQRGRDEVFEDYHLRVGEIIADTAPPRGLSVVEQHLEETESGEGKFVTLTEFEPRPDCSDTIREDALAGLVKGHAGLIENEVFASIYNKGKSALLVSWRDRPAADAFQPGTLRGSHGRHRIIRIVRDYGMYDRRESPQYYPDVPQA